MNILFILYHDFKSNSALHVYSYANALCRRGCNVIVAVPFGKDSYKEIDLHPLFNIVLFDDVISNRITDSEFEIIHAWTPREIIRKFYNRIKDKYKKAKLIIHLEDNEEAILKLSMAALKRNNTGKEPIPDHLSHPENYKKFIAESNGVTILMDTLAAFVPASKDPQMIWPIIDREKFHDKLNMQEAKAKYGISKEELVIAYTGNVHASNYREVRSLYLAVALANRNGMRVKLIRTGVDYYDFYENKSRWDLSPFIELGFVAYSEIPVILNCADILIQPGEPGPFNNYRLPSKLPEFLMMGKPVIMPATNLAKFLKENEEALLLQKGDALEILSKIKILQANPELKQKLSDNALKFALKNFNEEVNCTVLVNYYEKVLGKN